MEYQPILSRIFPDVGSKQEIHQLLIDQTNIHRSPPPNPERWFHTLDDGKGHVFTAINPQHWFLVRFLDHSQSSGPIEREDLAESVYLHDLAHKVITPKTAQNWLSGAMAATRPLLYALDKEIVTTREVDEEGNRVSSYTLEQRKPHELFAEPLKYLFAKVMNTGEEISQSDLSSLEAYTVAGVLLGRERWLRLRGFDRFDDQTKPKLQSIVETMPTTAAQQLTLLTTRQQLNFREGAVVAALAKTVKGKSFTDSDTQSIIDYLSTQIGGNEDQMMEMLDVLLSTEETHWAVEHSTLVSGFRRAIGSLRR